MPLQSIPSNTFRTLNQVIVSRLLRVALLTGFPLLLVGAATLSEAAEFALKDALAIRGVSRPGRSVIHLDPIEARIVTGQWSPPAEADTVITSSGEEQHWEKVAGNDQGAISASAARGGYVYWPVTSDVEQVLILEAAGHTFVYVNGEIRGGDSYGFGYLRVPVLLHKGTNEFLFAAGRGELRAKLVSAPSQLIINTADNTLPDIITGEGEPLWVATVLLNASTNFMKASVRAVQRGAREQLMSIPPLGIFKAPFLVRPPRVDSRTNIVKVTLEAVNRSTKAAPVRAEFNLRVRQPNQTYVRTFRSRIDSSVQYYAVNPPASAPARDSGSALFLSLHGASVEARGQAEAYSPKQWGYIVCPTNRRPYGFDWEEWGCWDAMEVLGLAQQRYRPDPQRIYLTGHSMGGHGTWHLGALYPDRFAAIGPSAGWVSFNSYVNANRPPATNAVQRMLRRAGAASETLLLATNYLQEGVYILHGDADDNVPVTEARDMRKLLATFHRDYDFHEQPGAGHWWDASDEPGTDCVDWAPMFDFFGHHIIPPDETVRRVRFVTVNPAVSSKSHWVSILAQEHALEPSSIDVRCDPGKRRLVGATTNVAQVCFEFPSVKPGAGFTIELDGQKLENLTLLNPKDCGVMAQAFPAVVPALCLARHQGQWRPAHYPTAEQKRPERSGPFRQAFQNHMVFVHGTKGTSEENAWTLVKARYDAETFYYRGNGSVLLMSDVEVIANETDRKRRERAVESPNLILYGHAECNAAWSILLANSPVQVHRGSIRLGSRELAGADLGCLFLQPHPRHENALIGVVGGSGMAGLRVLERMPYFTSGAAFPDWLIVTAALPAKGLEGIRGAGFFGNDWQVQTGDAAWSE